MWQPYSYLITPRFSHTGRGIIACDYESSHHPGQVTEILPDLKYRIILTDGKEILAYLGGKMKLHKIKVLVETLSKSSSINMAGRPPTASHTAYDLHRQSATQAP